MGEEKSKRCTPLLKTFVLAALISFSTLASSEAFGAEPHKTPVAKNHSKTATTDDVSKELYTLTQYTIDGAFILGQAADSLSNQRLKDKILKFKEESEEHISTLSSLVEEYGRTPPEHTRDFKGFFMQGYVAMRGMMSNKGVMKALHNNNRVILNAYEKSLKTKLPAKVKEVVKSILEVKRRQDQYIRKEM